MTSTQSNARCWKNLPWCSRSPLPFSCHSKMLLCSTASEQGESVILQVSQVPLLLASQAQKWSRVTPADMTSWRKDEMYHFYLLLKSLLPSSEDTDWGCHLALLQRAQLLLLGLSTSPVCQSQAQYSPCSVSGRKSCFLSAECAPEVKNMSPGTRPGMGSWYLLLTVRALAPLFFLTSPSLQFLIYKIRRTESYHWRLLGGSVEMTHRCRREPLLTVASAIIRVLDVT